ncbi:MAG: Fe-S cluster assembly sulfur transfer protein SufU [Pseudomonadota bacterium]
MSSSVYREHLLDHFRRPRNKGALDESMDRERGSNPRCGDDLEVGVSIADGQLASVRFHGRGCSVCIASASMLTETCESMPVSEARALCVSLEDWVGQRTGGESPHRQLTALDGARHHASRHTCILLAWRALAALLDRHSAASQSDR